MYKTVLKSFDAEIIYNVWICDLVKVQAQQAHTTTVVKILSFLPPVKINLTTLRNIFAQSVTSNHVNFVIFWNENMLRRGLRSKNKTLHYENSRKWYFAIFKKTGHSRMIL